MALTETQLKMCWFHGSLSQKGSRPPFKIINETKVGVILATFC